MTIPPRAVRPRVQITLVLGFVAAALAACSPGEDSLSTNEALVEFTVSGGSSGGAELLVVSSTNRAFVAEATRLLASGQTRVPIFDLRDGKGSDPQWSWHVDPASPQFTDVTIELCDGMPSDIESNKEYWLRNVRRYCPWRAKVTAVLHLQ